MKRKEKQAQHAVSTVSKCQTVADLIPTDDVIVHREKQDNEGEHRLLYILDKQFKKVAIENGICCNS